MNANSGTFNVERVGTVKFAHLINNETRKIVLNNVGFAPTGKRNLISGSRAMEAGCTWSGKQDEILIRNKTNKPILKFTRCKGLFKLSATGYSSDSNEVKSTSINGKVNVIENKSIGDLELWHRRMMHTNIDSMVNMSKGDIARGLPKLVKREMNCITCIKAKQTKHYGKAKTKITSSGVLDLVHTDVWGPTKYESKGGAKYFVYFVDDYSRWVKTYVMKSKSQVIDCFKDYMKRLTGTKIKRLRSDNGTEYCNDKLKQICKAQNIKHKVTNIYSPHMNVVAERFNRSAIEALRATIVDDNMDRMWWAEVLMAYTHVKNRLSQKLLEGQTPYERVFNRKPNIHYFRVIGSKCYRLLPKTQRNSKLGPVSKECILIGYSWNTKGYRIYDPEEDKVYNTQDVRFIESSYADATKNSISFGPDDNGNRGKSVDPPTPNPKVTLPIPTSSIPKVVIKNEGQSGSMGNWDRVVKQRPATGQHPNRYDATLSYQGQKFRSAKSVMKYCEDNKIDYSRESVKDSFKYNNPYMGPWDIRNVGDRGQRILLMPIHLMNHTCRQHSYPI
uniref:Integrase catalytic domain-containing protein n=1 Tax=Strigamia maritima TaxID=126957 RepID=T1IVV8_STRMM